MLHPTAANLVQTRYRLRYYDALADITSGCSLEEKMKLSSIALRTNAREDLLRMELELLHNKHVQRDQMEAFFISLSTNQVEFTK